MSEIRTDTINNASGDNDSGIDLSTNDQVSIKTANTTAVTVDASQRVVINVTPTAQFNHSILQVGNQATLGANKSLSSTGQTYLTHNLYYDTGGTLQVYNTSSANEGALLQMVDGQLRFSNSSATTGTPTVNRRFTIEAGGDVGINESSPTAQLHINVPNLANLDGLKIRNQTNNTGGYFIRFQNSSVGVAGYIEQTGTSTVAYRTSSDHRLKENVADMTGAIDRVKQLLPKRFNFIEDGADTVVDGFLAHEAQTVVPEAVGGTHNEVDEDGNPVYQGIDQSKIVPLLTGALKEAIAKIETLEARITALENA